MSALARGQASDCANPVLDIFTQVNGVLTDVAELTFQIFDVSDATKQQNPVQVYPPTTGTRTPVNVTDLCPVGDKLSTGRFVARWAPPVDASIGTYEIHWAFKLTASSPEQAFREEFEVLPEVTGFASTGYAFVSDLREEGVTLADASDMRLQRLISLASQYIDRVTGRFFEPRTMTLTVDGSGGRIQLLGHPIVAVSSVEMFVGMFAESGVLPVIPSFFRVYNRHLSQGLLDPDDREDPKLEFFHWSDLLGVHATPAGHLGLGSLVWLPGVQNVVIEGVFGYTEPDGSPTGKTPELIRHVTKLLVLREIPKMTDLSRREERQRRWRIVSERTRDQGYNLEALRLHGSFTGDPEIDNILVAYQRPAQAGAA
jgi:hypothetical protein